MDELKERRILSSFAELHAACRNEPLAALDALENAIYCDNFYTQESAAMIMLGMMIGALETYKHRGEKRIVLPNVEELTEIRPSDFIGPRRKYCRVGSFPKNSA